MKDKTICRWRFRPFLSCKMGLPDPWRCSDNGRLNETNNRSAEGWPASRKTRGNKHEDQNDAANGGDGHHQKAGAGSLTGRPSQHVVLASVQHST
jgi:hypothetical protein